MQRQASQNQIIKLYETVLFNLAQEKNDLEAVSQDIKQLYRCIQKDSQGWAQVSSYTTPYVIQRKVVEQMSSFLKLGKLTRHFLLVLCQNRRLQYLTSILEMYIKQSDNIEGSIEGILETTVKLSSKEIIFLQNALKRQLGQPVVLSQEIKKDLLAGAVLHIGSRMIDASLKTRLNKLYQVMKG